MMSSSRYATKCWTPYGSWTLACRVTRVTVSPAPIPCVWRGKCSCNVADRLLGGVNIALTKFSEEVRGLRLIASISMAGVSRSEYLQGMVGLRHRTRIFGFDVPRIRLFFGMTSVQSSPYRGFRSASGVVRPLCDLRASLGSKSNSGVWLKGADSS